MKNFRIGGIAIILVAVSMGAVAQGIKIGYVNPFRIQNESATAKRAMENLKKEFASREQEVAQLQKRVAGLRDELDKGPSTMSPDERQAKEKAFAGLARQLQQMQQDLVEDINLRKREEFGRVISAANAVIQQIAESGKYDLIVQDAAFSSPRTDITDQVLGGMAKRLEEKGTSGK